MYWSHHKCKAHPNPTEGEDKTCAQLLLKAAFEAATMASHECRNRLFHAIYCDLELHSKGKGKSLQSFCIPNSFIDVIGPALDPQIQNILCLHKFHRKYNASKLRKIFLIAMLSSEDNYIEFLGDMLRVDNSHGQLSDDGLPIEGSQLRGLNEKYAESFREFFWYQHLFLDGYCVGSCRFKQELLEKATSSEGSGEKPYLPRSPFNEKDLDKQKKVVRSAALTLSMMSHSDCQHTSTKKD